MSKYRGPKGERASGNKTPFVWLGAGGYSAARMNRREFMRKVSGTAVAVSVPTIWLRSGSAAGIEVALDKRAFQDLASVAMRTAKSMGAEYADIRVSRNQSQSINSREER